jgi:hypothetical protein
MVEMLRERLQEHFDRRRDQRTKELQVRREQLQAEAGKWAAEVFAFQKDQLLDDKFVSTESLRQHYLDLDKRRREDRLTLLNITAERQAIEKQIEALRQQSEEIGATTPLLEELKDNVTTRQMAAQKLRQSAKEESGEVKQLQLAVQQAEKMLQLAEQAFREGEQAHLGVEGLKGKLIESRARLAMAEADAADRIGRAELEATEGRIEYLRKKEELTQAQFGTQLQAFNGMLSQLAIQSDTAAARSEAIDIELHSVADSIRSASLIELQRKATDRQVQLLEAKLERVQQELIDVEMLLEKPQSQEFEISLWGE